ncbi:spore cortex-lytic enzyme [Listeria grayi]|uniref:N-acetylmuramoyl-L-alanine amidase n=1 Tax=Listeria grayi FSL F6-1183 TaxID=1265827 RepID=A0A829R9Q1_LISGR|nr:peptidoglycan-binding domain-containing protein [Listeria grayi]EUJ29878.1 N-acetylmuramoyl-L-alanine amidase [Listeria grayi FSL F6-1183]VEI34262.1 spore cortex-lytic enzyme [Listeria grayi]
MNVKAINLKKVFLSISMVVTLSMSFVGISCIKTDYNVEAAALQGLHESYYSMKKDSKVKKADVATIQVKYNNWLYNVSTITYFMKNRLSEDGYFGNNTFLAIRYYQSKHKDLSIDGVVGKSTWKYLRLE